MKFLEVKVKTKKAYRMQRMFGIDELGIIDVPRKFSNIRISRIQNFIERGGCPFCFPHGDETSNSKYGNLQKNWKKFRRTQWK